MCYFLTILMFVFSEYILSENKISVMRKRGGKDDNSDFENFFQLCKSRLRGKPHEEDETVPTLLEKTNEVYIQSTPSLGCFLGCSSNSLFNAKLLKNDILSRQTNNSDKSFLQAGTHFPERKDAGVALNRRRG